jgi:hypothetical protein
MEYTDETHYTRTCNHIEIIEIANNNINKLEQDNKDEYFVEEPYDYIFEPDHNPPAKRSEDHLEKSEQILNDQKPSDQSITAKDNGKKFTHTRMVKETNGFLEYEYFHKSANLNNQVQYQHHDDYNYYESHLDANIRGISLCKWPVVGFGLKLNREVIDNETFTYVSEMQQDSPAEFGLQLGDIVLEIDEENPNEKFVQISELNDYINSRDSLHLVVIHHTKYFDFKRNNLDLLTNYHINCDDIVIVTWNKRQIEQQI